MVHPGAALADDGPLVEVRRHEVRRGADEAHARHVRLAVRVPALERRQEAVVDVQHFAAVRLQEAFGENLAKMCMA